MTKLNLGCGTDIRNDFINVDIKALPGVNVIADVTELELKNNSIDFIVAQHLLEFIPRKKLISLLQKLYSFLTSGGYLEIRITDLSLVTKALYLNTVSKEMGLHHEMVIALLYGQQLDEFDIRLNGFTVEFLEGLLVGIGFKVNTIVSENFDSIITVRKP